MNSSLATITNPPVFSFEGHKVRVVMQNNDPWFVAMDYCKATGMYMRANGKANPATMVECLDADEVRVIGARWAGTSFGRGVGSVTLISESGLYKLIMRTNHTANPTVARFQNWVTREVLPSIRKDGGYIMGEEKLKSGEMSEDEFILKAMTILKSKAERLTEERDNLKGIVDAHLVNLTIDEWRALNGQYLTRSTILTLAHRMKKRLAQLGVEVPRESRTFEHPKRKGHLIPTSVKVYPKNILDEVAKELGLKVNMQFRTSRAA